MLYALFCLLSQVEGQPLAANAERVARALDFLGVPLPAETAEALRAAGEDAGRVQAVLDPLVAFRVALGEDPSAVGGPLRLQQAGWTPVLVKVVNPGGSTSALRVSSPQAGPVYAGAAELSLKRQGQPSLRDNENARGDDRFLELEMFGAPPMTPRLSGLGVEYAVLLVYVAAAGARQAVVRFEVDGRGAEAAAAIEARPAVEVRLSIKDIDGRPTVGRLVFTDAAGRVYPPQPKRTAPDFFFQRQIYRADGDTVLLPPGKLRLEASRGPEYRVVVREVKIPPAKLEVRLERWIDATAHGHYPGDHHIHAAGCAHYMKPSEGVRAADMFLQVKGEGLNVGCILTWGPAFDVQHRYFSPAPDPVSEALTVLKYDIEVSGFGSAALGHVCLLNLREQIYPGAKGTSGWPSWTTPVLRWARAQGAVTGYAHSGSGLQVDPAAAARRLMEDLDRDRDGRLSSAEASAGVVPEPVGGDGMSEADLVRALDRAADRLPNLAIPEMNSVGAMELPVAVAQGVCDFISAMDTARIPEWNMWYHVMNAGFPLKVSGETDFPCMSSTRVGQGRVYVRLGKVDRIDYASWCEGVAKGRSYVSDGYAHALEFEVGGRRSGDTLALDVPTRVKVSATVAFASATPAETPYGGLVPPEGLRVVGDTVVLRPAGSRRLRAVRTVDLVVNGRVAASREVPADDRPHALAFEVDVERSSWIALREFPQLHTNPVVVTVGGRPIRASRSSALWCAETIRRLWRVREKSISPAEREEAKRTFDAAVEQYRRIAAECP